jgi:hypothetical protein
MSLEEKLLRGFTKAMGVSADDSLRAYLRGSQIRPPANARLLAWDANSIHSFVFDTTNASGIRGASHVLSDLDAALNAGEHLAPNKGQVLFAGGGNGVAVVAEDAVDACTRSLHQLFAERTTTLTCTVASVDLIAGDQPFNDRMRALSGSLARERVLTGPDAEPALPFFAARCRVCGRRAAAVSQPRAGGERLECQPCNDRIQHAKNLIRGGKESEGFETIADRDGQGFIAVMYLDGNGIGKTVTTLKSPLEYAVFSETIDRVLKSSFKEVAKTYDLLEDVVDQKSRGHYQRPICGGDDVVAILPGNLAVPFTRDLLKRLEEQFEQTPELRGRNLGASAGVAIGKATFPIRYLFTEAESLLGTAKRRFYDAKPEAGTRSALSFAVVTDGSPPSESTEPARWKHEEGPLLSGRPYTLKEFETFSQRFETVRNAKIGRTQLYALQNQALLGLGQFRNHVLYQIGRHEEWRTLTQALGQGSAENLREPNWCEEQFWPKYGGRHVFDVNDMIELLRHWPEPEKEAVP